MRKETNKTTSNVNAKSDTKTTSDKKHINKYSNKSDDNEFIDSGFSNAKASDNEFLE